MNGHFVVSDTGITLVAGGPVDRTTLRMALKQAPMLVAADGGADRALCHGVEPIAVIGDLDSISDAARVRLGAGRLHHVAEQETTDLDKCLRSIKARFILAIGVTGGRLDHALAALSSLLRHQKAGGAPCIVIAGRDVIFAAPRSLALRLPLGERISLFPMAAITGRSTGLRWPIDGLTLAPDGRIGTSNEVQDRRVTLDLDSDGMLVILPRRNLRAVIAALV